MYSTYCYKYFYKFSFVAVMKKVITVKCEFLTNFKAIFNKFRRKQNNSKNNILNTVNKNCFRLQIIYKLRNVAINSNLLLLFYNFYHSCLLFSVLSNISCKIISWVERSKYYEFISRFRCESLINSLLIINTILNVYDRKHYQTLTVCQRFSVTITFILHLLCILKESAK